MCLRPHKTKICIKCCGQVGSRNKTGICSKCKITPDRKCSECGRVLDKYSNKSGLCTPCKKSGKTNDFLRQYRISAAKKRSREKRNCPTCGKLVLVGSAYARHTKACSEQRSCIMCGRGVDFRKKNRNKFCSPECFYLSRIKLDRFQDCIICKKTFKLAKTNLKRITCSKPCEREKHVLNSVDPNKKQSGCSYMGKKCSYNGVSFDSSWEVQIAKWLDSNNIKWIRDRKINLNYKDKEGKIRRYIPDFYLEDMNVYLDPKNKRVVKMQEYKISQVLKENNINLIYGEIEHIKSKVCDLLLSNYTEDT